MGTDIVRILQRIVSRNLGFRYNRRTFMAIAIGQQLGSYEVIVLLGKGGMGEVYRARDTKLNRPVAIKFLSNELADAAARRRFQREAQLASSLNHPHILTVYDVGEFGGSQYLVTEYIDGGTLKDWAGAEKRTWRHVVELMVGVADGLAAAHGAGILHRDIKPVNILVAKNGYAKLADFGLAKLSESTEDDATRTLTDGDTRPGVILGTVVYMSPEQAAGKPLDLRSDIFSFAVVLYELLAGRNPFAGATELETLQTIIHRQPAPLGEPIPLALRMVIEKALEKDPAERYQSTRDLTVDLRRLLRGKTEHVTPLPVAPPLRSGARFWRATSIALMLGLVLMAFWPVPPQAAPRLTPFATEFEIQMMPRWSPKGDRMAYVAAVNGIFQVFTKRLGASVATQATHEKESSFNPFWSPDETRIYFLMGQRPAGSLWSIAIAGGAPQKILDGVVAAELSPDGNTLAVLAPTVPGQYGLYRLAFSSPPGANPKFYSQAPLSDFQTNGAFTFLQFDRNGKYLGLFSSVRSRDEFWKVPLDGSSPRELLHGRSQRAGSFSWLPDGTRIVSDRAWLDSHLTVIKLGSGQRDSVTSGALQDFNPALSPDGRSLAFATGEVGSDVIEVPLDGSAPRDVISTKRNEVSPAWAPDGVHFVYVTDRNGGDEVWLRNRLDGTERLIAGPKDFPQADAFQLYDCAIAPDGSRVAYRRFASGAHRIWISPLSGEPPVPFWNDPANTNGTQRGPSWSPDGNWIAYYGTYENKPAVLKSRVGANAPPEVLAFMATLQPVRWSPRGDWVAFPDDQSLRIVSPDGKQNRILSQRKWETFGWSKDGTALLGIAFNENRHQFLGRIDIATGKETQITDLGPVSAAFDFGDRTGNFPYRGFSLHPDGTSFLTSVLRVKTQIYVLEDFDRSTRLAGWLWGRITGETR
jgi:serine/threonine protein kinase/Tol biopolymer transport system component